MNQKALLHRASFAVLLIVCCALQAQVPAQNAPLQTVTPQTVAAQSDSKANLQTEEKNAKNQYAQALQACDSKLAPAQCKRQARLDYQKSQHDIKLRRDAVDTAQKQAKHAKSSAEKTRNIASAKQGLDPAGQPLQRAPISKQQASKRSASQPLSKQQTVKPKDTTKQPMAKKAKPKTPKAPKNSAETPPKPLAAQPTPDQRRANVADFAKKESDIAMRKTQVNAKQAKRAAKDEKRRAAGYTVDKP